VLNAKPREKNFDKENREYNDQKTDKTEGDKKDIVTDKTPVEPTGEQPAQENTEETWVKKKIKKRCIRGRKKRRSFNQT